MKNIYDFEMRDYKGKTFSFKQFKGMVIIVVNVASKCGLSNSSYERMKTIYHEHQNVIFVLCPCKQFLNQEHDHPEDIADFVSDKMGIKKENISSSTDIQHQHVKEIKRVILTEPIQVKGEHIHPVYEFLTNEKGGWLTNSIKWNFSSFLISSQGEVLKRYSPMDFIQAHDKKLIEACRDATGSNEF
ncbi:GPX2 [Ecytonucleospora hepatopenaei]|uniref:Glutathione peroxidase n=1 Tax=Ecytonucleospora hepatopenaei TaxID=646526 RepID=A0A1W0E3U1_9MICR|nr:GPX2 [Ecytonucleospora hepatopenaei]